MSTCKNQSARGFTAVELTVVILIVGIVAAMAAPRITSAMREYRLNIAMRQVADLLNKAKMHAVSESNRSGIAIDITGRQMGLVRYQADGVTVAGIDFVPLPDGVSFVRPSAESSVPRGVTGSNAVSFAVVDGYHRQNFNSRGFPVVASGADVVSIFVGNGRDFRAITMSSVGGLRTYHFEAGDWKDTRSAS